MSLGKFCEDPEEPRRVLRKMERGKGVRVRTRFSLKSFLLDSSEINVLIKPFLSSESFPISIKE